MSKPTTGQFQSTQAHGLRLIRGLRSRLSTHGFQSTQAHGLGDSVSPPQAHGLRLIGEYDCLSSVRFNPRRRTACDMTRSA